MCSHIAVSAICCSGLMRATNGLKTTLCRYQNYFDATHETGTSCPLPFPSEGILLAKNGQLMIACKVQLCKEWCQNPSTHLDRGQGAQNCSPGSRVKECGDITLSCLRLQRAPSHKLCDFPCCFNSCQYLTPLQFTFLAIKLYGLTRVL